MIPIHSAINVAALLLSLAASQALNAATYYIDPVSGLDANPGTLAQPVKTLTRGGVLAGPGDTVYLRGTGPYNDPGRTERCAVFDNTWSGTAGNVVTVQAYPGETVVFDPGYPEFRRWRNTAWVPCTEPGAHPDEYISVKTYDMANNDGAWGSFLNADGTAGDRLLTYSMREDLRATQESCTVVPYNDPRPGSGYLTGDDPTTPQQDETQMKVLWAYRGPGLWWDPATKKIHFRASATHWNQPGIADYAGRTDPRTLALSISLKNHFGFYLYTADHIVFKNIVIQNGGDCGGAIGGLSTNYADHVTFDHCTFYPSRNGMGTGYARFLTFRHCVFDGRLPSYVCRSDVKDDFDYYVSGQSGPVARATTCRMTQVCLLMTSWVNEDMELANCEFRNGHDGVQLWGTRPRLHHSLLENLNDEAIMFYGYDTGADIRIYNNVLRKVLQPFSCSQGSWNDPAARYIYRNIVDSRVPTLGYRMLPPDPLLIWRVGQDFKVNEAFPEMYCYQNTFVMPPISDRWGSECSAAWTGATEEFTRRYMNNVYLAMRTDRPLYTIPHPTFPDLSDGNVWCRRVVNPTSALFNSYNWTTYATWDAMHAAFPNWEAHSQNLFVNPQLANVADYNPTDGGTYLNADYCLKDTSPARGAGVDLTATGWPDTAAADSTPDIGALPYGTSAVAVGVDGRYVFPDASVPIAEAGDYSGVSDTDQDGFVTVAFDGTGSSDPDGTIVGYNWALNGQPISTASTFTKALPVGSHQVWLTVTDNSGATAKDLREVAVTTTSTLDNLVRNPGFESGSTGWTLTRAGPVVTTPTHFGTGALSLVGQSLSVEAEQPVPVVSGVAVTVSGWLKTTNLPATKHAKFQLTWWNASGGAVGSTYYLAGLTGTNDWAYYSTTQIAPPAAVIAKLKVQLDDNATGGTAYVDDLRLMVGENKLVNGFFEKGMANWSAIGDTPTIATTTADVRSGTQALKMTGGGPMAYYQTYQDFPAAPGTAYTISGWIKTGSVQVGRSACLWLEWYNSSNTKLGSTLPVGAALTGTNAYTFRQATLTAPANAAYGRVICRFNGAAGSTAWFDDIHVQGSSQGAMISNSFSLFSYEEKSKRVKAYERFRLLQPKQPNTPPAKKP